MKALKYWWPAVAWACVIFFFATEVFSGATTSRIIIPFLRWLLPNADPETLGRLHVLIRKGAHVASYFVFSWLVLRGVRGEARGWTWRWGITSLLIAAGYALLDEFHQSFVPGRGAAVRDVILDVAGATLAQVAASFRQNMKPQMNADQQR
jgi:VanZ family protein